MQRPILKSLLALTACAAFFGASVRADDGNSSGRSEAQAGALKAGNMLVRLEQFVELRDGRVQARLSFRNLDLAQTTSFALDGGDASHRQALRLTNGAGVEYRLVRAPQSPEGQWSNGQEGSDWVAVAPGAAVSFSAIFTPDGAMPGQQPFALSLPVHMVWYPDGGSERTSAFDINFGGLHRPTEGGPTEDRLTDAHLAEDLPPPRIARAEPVSLLPPKAPAPALAHFDDDLTPAIAALPAAQPDSRRYLFAVGVEQYDDAPSVPFADRSARAMADLLRKRYGIPDENVNLLTGGDATGMKIMGRLNSLIARLTEGDTVYFYYAGHGLSARDGNAVYIVPKDAVPGAYEVEMLSLGSLLRRFESSHASRVVAFLDTCFSGRIGQHDSLFPGAAPLVPEPLPSSLASSSKTTLFLAGQGYQFANDYPERGHRLFSYFVMRGLLDGYDDAASLGDFVAREVRRVSARRGAEFLQEPKLEGAALSLARAEPARPLRPAH